MHFTAPPELAARVSRIERRLESFPRAKRMLSPLLPHIQGSPLLDQNTTRFLAWARRIKTTRTSLTPGQPDFYAALASADARTFNGGLYSAHLALQLKKTILDLFRMYLRFLETMCSGFEYEVAFLEMWNTEQERERQGVYTRYLPCGIAVAERHVAILNDTLEGHITTAMDKIRTLSRAFDRFAWPFRPPPLPIAVALLRGLEDLPRPPALLPSGQQQVATSA